MNLCKCIIFIILVIMTRSVLVLGAPVGMDIKMDYFGYRPGDKKVAIVTRDPGFFVEIHDIFDSVVLVIPSDGGSIMGKGFDDYYSGDNVWWVDFSFFTTPGVYHIFIPLLGIKSYNFEIREDIYDNVNHIALKSFYYQRCNTPKDSIYAGAWSDPVACHMADSTLTAAPGAIDRGTLDLTGGWHDAGDYNKYAWRAVSDALMSLLMAYDDNPGVFKDGDLNIPESGNGVPDILDEVKWELDFLLKMQLPSGAILRDVHSLSWDAESPPSADISTRFYSVYGEPNSESGGIFVGSCAMASRIFLKLGMMTYASKLKNAALKTWNWLLTQPDSNYKVWAAAEVFSLDNSVTSARDYIDNYYLNNWKNRFFNVENYDTHCALRYLQTPGATPVVITNMASSVNDQVDYIFSNLDLYRNGMPAWSYGWGSNRIHCRYGTFLIKAAMLGYTGSYSGLECWETALEILHFMHGQNAMNMVYLSNMADYGGEHSVFQLHHGWFGNTLSANSVVNHVGKPLLTIEPAYPYFSGIDNFGFNDNKTSNLGPAPGFVPGGPNKDYSGSAMPPANAIYYNKFYRDWCEDSVVDIKAWEITENQISYQGAYVFLCSYFMVRSTMVPLGSYLLIIVCMGILLCITIYLIVSHVMI